MVVRHQNRRHDQQEQDRPCRQVEDSIRPRLWTGTRRGGHPGCSRSRSRPATTRPACLDRRPGRRTRRSASACLAGRPRSTPCPDASRTGTTPCRTSLLRQECRSHGSTSSETAFLSALPVGVSLLARWMKSLSWPSAAIPAGSGNGNPNFEIRTKSEISTPNVSNEAFDASRSSPRFCISNFGSWNLFRISKFGFQTSCPPYPFHRPVNSSHPGPSPTGKSCNNGCRSTTRSNKSATASPICHNACRKSALSAASSISA